MYVKLREFTLDYANYINTVRGAQDNAPSYAFSEIRMPLRQTGTRYVRLTPIEERCLSGDSVQGIHSQASHLTMVMLDVFRWKVSTSCYSFFLWCSCVLIPQWSRYGPNTFPRWSKNDSSMVPTLSPNGPNAIPRWSQNDARMIPK